MDPVPPSWTTVKMPVVRVVRVVLSSTATPPRPRALPSWITTAPRPWAPCRASWSCCSNSRTTLTWRPLWPLAPTGPATMAARSRAAAARRTFLPRNLGLLRQAIPHGLPLGQMETDGLRLLLHLIREGLAHLVVVAELEPVAAVHGVPRRARAAEDVHGADVPLGQRGLGFIVGLGILGELLDPELAVADVELFLLEDALDGPHPRPVRALPHVLQLVAGPAVHAEVEEDEVRPRVDGVVEDVHALVRRDARSADVCAGVDAHGKSLVVRAHVRLHVHAEVSEETVHDGGVAVLVFHDLRHDVLLIDPGGLHDPRHVAVAARQLGVRLHSHEMDQVLAILVRHFLRGLDTLPALEPGQEVRFRHVLAHGALLSTTRTALPSLRGTVLGGTMTISGLRLRWARRSSPIRADSAARAGPPASKPPHPCTASGVGSTSTAMVGKPSVRSTIS